MAVVSEIVYTSVDMHILSLQLPIKQLPECSSTRSIVVRKTTSTSYGIAGEHMKIYIAHIKKKKWGC